MKKRERGFTYIELLVALSISALLAVAATMAIFQVLNGTEQNNNRVTTVREVQNASYWINRDAQMSQSATTDNLTSPDFLILVWTEWDEAGDPIYHSVKYSFVGLDENIGTLTRNHWSSEGLNVDTRIAQYIYYNPSDTDNTSEVSYESPILTVRLTSIFGDSLESREYKIKRRPNF